MPPPPSSSRRRRQLVPVFFVVVVVVLLVLLPTLCRRRSRALRLINLLKTTCDALASTTTRTTTTIRTVETKSARQKSWRHPDEGHRHGTQDTGHRAQDTMTLALGQAARCCCCSSCFRCLVASVLGQQNGRDRDKLIKRQTLGGMREGHTVRIFTFYKLLFTCLAQA